MAIKIERRRLFSGFDGKFCKVDPKLMTDGKNALLSWQLLLLSGSDVFYDSFASVSRDGGATFGQPKKLSIPDRFESGVRIHTTPINTFYSKFHNKWLFIGLRQEFEDDTTPKSVGGISLGRAVLSLVDIESGDVSGNFTEIPMPIECLSACPHGQIIEYENGELLLSFNVTTPERHFGSIVTARYALDGDRLRIVESGAPIYGDKFYSPPEMRGLVEASIARLRGKYYITIRNDERGYFAESDDGLSFSEPKPWIFDDGNEVGSYNTMQRWVRFEDRLYLAYTRRDRLNGHVFRHRAPMYMTRFDETRGCLIRDEELILVPELGARLGNFSVTDISPNEAILITAEWMQPAGCEKYGSDNSIWMVRIREE